jgi:hypothetical protein
MGIVPEKSIATEKRHGHTIPYAKQNRAAYKNDCPNSFV